MLTVCMSAGAATITFSDLIDPIGRAPSGGITVTRSDNPNTRCALASLTPFELCTVTGTLPDNTDVPFLPTTTNINIYDPNEIDVSDTLSITTLHGITIGNFSTPSTFTAVFRSDGTQPLTPLPNALSYVEDGTEIDVFAVGGLHFVVASDVDTPEPSSMALLGGGTMSLSLLGFYRRRRAS